MKLRTQTRIKSVKRTKLGRTLCCLAGNQTGAVMMEYVILGVLIAAAATMAAIFFGKGIVNSFTTMTHATVGQVDKAKTSAEKGQTSAETAATESENDRKKISGGDGANSANK